MLALVLLALGLGAALTVYEFSPRTRTRVDDYARAIRAAHVAHRTADAHLGNANAAVATATHHAQQADAARQAAPRPTPPPVVQPPVVQPPVVVQPTPVVQPPVVVQPTPVVQPPVVVQPSVPAPGIADAQANAADIAADAAVDHAANAIEANQNAAKNTADAAKNAQTEAQRREAAQSAAKVLEREKQIVDALKSLGFGQCGVRTYYGITERAKNAILAKLRAEGMIATGDNPWNIDTRQYDVKLRAVWDPAKQEVKVIVVTGKGGYAGLVTCEEIWKKINPIMKGVVGG